jgi:hypothetical protein
MINPTQIILVLTGICILGLTSCSKKEIMEIDNESQSVVDNAIADQEFMALVPSVYQSALATKGTGAQNASFTPSCDSLAYVSGDTISFIPNPVYSVDFSNTSCSLLAADGKKRSGKIQVRLTGKIKIPGSQMILKFTNYTASGISYSCDSLVMINKGSGTDNTSFNVQLVKGVCKTDSFLIKYEFDRTVSYFPKGDPAGTDAVTYIFGQSSGTNRQGVDFSTNVAQETSLVKHKTCPYIDKGIMELTPKGFKQRKVDFGNGICDDEATFTVNENTVAFRLK